MLSYLAFIHYGIESIGNPLSDGKILAERCLGQLEALKDPKQFPPRLLILLASSAYLDRSKSEQLLNGVLYGFDEKNYRDVPLMGCSVAAVFFNRRIYHEGALLVCLASRLLEATVKASPDTRQDPEKAIRSLLQKLGLFTEKGEEIHSFSNRTFFTLFPGFCANKYPAPELHEILRAQLGGRVSIFGGVASANDPQRLRSGILFANRKVHRHAVVAASVECGTPFGISLTQGLTDTGRILNVAELDAQDPRVIREFREGGVAAEMEKLRELSPMPLFTNLALDRDPIVDTPFVDGDTVRLTREIHKREPFHILVPEPETMRQIFRSGVKKSLDKEWLLNPIGALGFRCTGLLRHHKQIHLDLKHENVLIEHDLALRGIPNEKPFVGGFVDGEAGIDKNGKSVFGNWSNATLVLGDELRFRTPIYRSFERLAIFAGRRAAQDLKTGLDRLTQLVYDIGFPGAMFSFCLPDYEQQIIVGVSASGPRYSKVLDQMWSYPLNGDDILAIVAREQQAQLIIDSRTDKRKVEGGSIEAAAKAGIVSQYLVPLAGNGSEVMAVLQIDLGDISYDTHLYPTEKTVLESLGKIINSGLKRTFNWEENTIIRKLDQAMSVGLSAVTIKQGLQLYLEHALTAFGLKQGHIRIAQEDRRCLSLVAGVGEYYEETRKKRQNIDFGDLSLTAQTFRAGEIIIINDTQHNKAHQEMCERWKDEEVLCQKLRAVGAYANVPFVSNRGERGTINLISSAPWFFTRFHESTLELLGERVGFLLETLRRKEGELFLLGVSPQFSKIHDLNDMDAVLASEIKQFAKTVKAKVASLYLWEEDRQRYILRAQYGWPRPEWVNAAYYMKKEFWTGTLALAGKPDRRGKLWQHIWDLHRYYSGSLLSARRYSTDAFGQELSEEFTIEAIPLQLRIAEDLLGVLTLYRPIKRGDESGFITTDTKLLQQGADNFSGLISVLQTRRRKNWEKQQHARRQEIYDATLPTNQEAFERRVCLQTLKSYQASKAHFYKVEIVEDTPRITLEMSLHYDSKTERVEDSAVASDEEKLVRMAVQANRDSERVFLTERVQLGGKEWESPEWSDPKRVAVLGLVRRACIPLFGQKQLVGLLDLQWSGDYPQADATASKPIESLFRVVGEIIGSAYRNTQTTTQAETLRQEAETKLQEGEDRLRQSKDQTRDVVQTTSVYVLKHHHELRRIIQQMSSLLGSLRALPGELDGKEKELIDQLSDKIRESVATLRNMIGIGRKMARPVYKRQTLRGIILSALQKARLNHSYDIQVDLYDPSEEHSVLVDAQLIEIAFSYLLDNAIKAMRGRDPQILGIRMESVAGNRDVKITIEDTGIGMTEEEIQQILREFFSRRGRISVGVTIARMILGLHAGRLAYESVKGEGTKTLVTMPLNYYLEEEAYD